MNSFKIPLLRQIAWKKLFDNKMRHFSIVVAIVLTTIFFTVAFSSLFYIKDSIQSLELEYSGWSAHGAVVNVTDEQYELMKQSNIISSISYYEHIGYVQDKNQTSQVEIQYCEDTMLSWMYYKLVDGHMPKSDEEIVVSIEFLDNKGLNYKNGMKLEIEYSINGKMQSREFVISGVYDRLATSSEVVFASKAFLNDGLESVKGSEIKDSELGLKAVEIMFSNNRDMEDKMKKFLEGSNAQKNKWTLNQAYLSTTGLGVNVVIAMICVLVLIMLCGYFIIYNIYHISVMQDTRFYGSLATLGLSEIEIRKMIRIMTNFMCVFSIPIGLVVGLITAMLILPQILASYGTEVISRWPHPLIFVFSAIFSYLTVRISSRKPINVAVKISPIEAKNYIAVRESKINKYKTRRGNHLYLIAWKNAMKEPKKAVLICASLSLCIILTSLFYHISNGVNMKVFLSDVISSDYIIGSKQYFNKVGGMYTPLNPEIINSISTWEGATDFGGANVTNMKIVLEDKAFTKFKEITKEEGINKEHTMESDLYGVDDFVFQKFTVNSGELDLDKFRTGDYIVVGSFVESEGTLSCYDVGDKVNIIFGDGSEKEYIVMAVADIPYDLSTRVHYAYSANLYLPSEEWEKMVGKIEYYVYSFDVKDNFENEWDFDMSQLIWGQNDLVYESKQTYEKQLDGYIRAISILGMSISIILGMIGIMNFINVIYSSVHNRKRELAIMQSMGMDKNEIYMSIILEGAYYIVISLVSSIVIGIILNFLIISAIGNAMEFIVYRWSILPYIVLGIVGILLSVIVPIIAFDGLDKSEDLLCRLHQKV